MRIIAGRARGTKLEAVPGWDTRPTADRVKEGLFNTIQMDITPKTRVLDVFAGTGALGLEALSRGACQAVFIEKEEAARRVISRNIGKCHTEDKCRILAGRAEEVLPTLDGEAFDLIFLDPPYRAGLYDKAFSLIKEYQLLAKFGIIVAEYAKDALFFHDDKVFLLYKSKSYGETAIYFYRNPDTHGRDT